MKLKRVENIPNFYIDNISGVYYVRKMIKGRPLLKSTGFTTFKSALKRYHELMAELNELKVGWKPPTPTLQQWWLKYREAKTKSNSTWQREDSMMKHHILPEFGSYSNEDITKNQIERYLNSRRKEAPPGTVVREQSFLHAVFEAALEDDLIIKNPLKGIPRQKPTIRTRVLTLEEQAKLMDVTTPLFGRWLNFMLGTGLRLEEAFTIKPSKDINLINKSISVIGKGNKLRVIPILGNDLLNLIMTQLSTMEVDSLWPYVSRTYQQWLSNACEKAEVESLSPHILRHTFATRYLAGGGDIFILSQILGHATVGVTQKVYAHLQVQDHARLSAHVDLGLTPTKVA